MIALMYVLPVSCASGVPRRSRSGPMQAQTDPQTRPFFSSSACTYFGSMCDGSSIGISTDSKPHFLNMGNSLVDSLVNGDVNKNVLIPSLMAAHSANARGFFKFPAEIELRYVLRHIAPVLPPLQ